MKKRYSTYAILYNIRPYNGVEENVSRTMFESPAFSLRIHKFVSEQRGTEKKGA